MRFAVLLFAASLTLAAFFSSRSVEQSKQDSCQDLYEQAVEAGVDAPECL